MTDNRPIGIFDSGIGGLTVANAVVRLLPNEDIYYLGDTHYIPYGAKSAEWVQARSEQIIHFLLRQNCKAILIACNTATAAALHLLRQKFPELPIIGMEPAVKPAAEQTQSGIVGVLATAGTFASDRYQSLTDRFAEGVTVLENPCTGLVKLIEAGQIDGPEVTELLRSIVLPMLDEGADTFVLGCTHYPYILPALRELLGQEATIINPAPAVARQTKRVLEAASLLAASTPAGHFTLATTGPLPDIAVTQLAMRPKIVQLPLTAL